jgi:DNA-binding response OmpR family regulator
MHREPWLVQIIADEIVILLAVARAYRDSRVDVITASHPDQALAQMETFNFDLFLLDLDIKDGCSMTLLEHISQDSVTSPVILMTTRNIDCPDLSARIARLRPQGCWHLLEKPFDFRKLKSYIDRGIVERFSRRHEDSACTLDDPHNSRRCHRFARNEPFKISLAGDESNATFPATLTDISVGGLGITTHVKLPPQSSIFFDEKFMHQSGQVVWSQAVDNQTCRAGIRFT